MSEITIPSSFQEIQSLKCFQITDCDAARNQSSDELEEKLEGFIEQCSDGSVLFDSSLINLTYSAIVNWSDIGDANKNLFAKLMHTLAEVCVVRMDETSNPQEKRTIIISLYFFQQFCMIAEKAATSAAKDSTTTTKTGKAKSSKSNKSTDGSVFNWPEWRQVCLDSFSHICTAPLNKLFPMGILQENFMIGFWSYPLKLLEDRPAGIAGVGKREVACRQQCSIIIGKVMAQFGSSSAGSEALCAALVNALMKSEHMVNHLVDLCCSSAGDILTEVVISEIGRLDAGNLTATALKNIAAYLESFASSSPSIMMKYIPIMVLQLDSPAHQIRSAVVACIGHIIAHIHQLVLAKAELKEETAALEAAIEAATDEEQPFDINISNAVQLTNIRDSLIELLAERVRDSSPYTRSSVLKTWVSLLENGAVPVAKVFTVCEIAVDRLVDKNSLVRRQAAALLTATLDHNPFSGDLDLRLYSKQQEDLRAQYAARVDTLRANVAALLPVEPVDPDAEPVEDEDNAELCGDIESDAAVLEIRTKLDVVRGIVRFIEAIGSAHSLMVNMLKSKLSSDVVEGLQYFSRAINFNVQGAMLGFKSAFTLVWHQEPAIKSALLGAFVDVYLTDGAGAEKASTLSPDEMTYNMVRLIQSCSDHEIVSLERIIVELLAAGKVDQKFFDAVWTRMVGYDTAPTNISHSELAATLRLFCIVAKSVPGLLNGDRMQTILRVSGLDHVSNSVDSLSLKAGIQCILTVPSCLSAEGANAVVMTSVPMLVKVILGEGCENNDTATKSWFSVCEEAVHALYHIHSAADKVMGATLHRMYFNLNKRAAGGSLKANSGNVYELSRFLFALGQTAISTLVFTEALAAKAKKCAPVSASTAAEKAKDKAVEVTAVDAMEEEMGCAAAADADHDKLLSEIVEREIVVRNLLGKFLPLILFVVANERKNFSHPLVRETSVLTLCRFMATSSVVCEQSLSLLFTVLEAETSEKIRTSVVITLGDLAFRFPNLVEPWTDRIYSRLRDASQTVRYNTLMVVTNLVLNDMIKVKGQISHVVLSLNDPCEAIRELAKLFFIKLSERSNNPVYNILGDIIGNFSAEEYTHGSAALSGEEFQSTMHFLLSFVEKDKQADSLLERLLARMALTPNVTHRRKLAFCISELNVTEKGIKRMVELVKNIKDSLFDGEIYDSFKLLLSKVKKTARSGGAAGGPSAGEVKSAIDELDQLMDAIVNSDGADGVEGSTAPSTAEGASDEAGDAVKDEPVESSRSTRTTARKTTAAAGKKAAAGGSKSASGAKTSTRKKTAKKVVDSSEDEMDFSAGEEEEEEELENVKPKAAVRTGGRRGVKQ